MTHYATHANKAAGCFLSHLIRKWPMWFCLILTSITQSSAAENNSMPLSLDATPHSMSIAAEQNNRSNTQCPGDNNSVAFALNEIADSADLMKAEQLLQSYAKQFASVSQGVRGWIREGKVDGIGGAQFVTRTYRLGDALCKKENAWLIRSTLNTAENQTEPPVQIRNLKSFKLAEINALYTIWVPKDIREGDLISKFARDVQQYSQQHSNIQMFFAQAHNTTMQRSGLLFVDPETTEALWFFAQAVKMSGHLRNAPNSVR